MSGSCRGPTGNEIAAGSVGACCGDKSASRETAAARQLPIVWQRLVSAGGTCPRCDATYQHLQSAVAKLREALKPLNVEPILEIREISEGAFRKDSAQSNRIWIGDKSIEEWIGAGVGSSKCCSVCGDEPCRTMVVGDATFEEIPEAIIMKAALIAASGLIDQTD